MDATSKQDDHHTNWTTNCTVLSKLKKSFPQQQYVSPYLEDGRFIMFSTPHLSSPSDPEQELHQIQTKFFKKQTMLKGARSMISMKL
jgi:elongation factor P--beta-lysine ligase